jgi:hypothetical protein
MTKWLQKFEPFIFNYQVRKEMFLKHSPYLAAVFYPWASFTLIKKGHRNFPVQNKDVAILPKSFAYFECKS